MSNYIPSPTQDHREFLMELDSHKSLMMSVNVISSHLSEHSRDRPRVERLQGRLGAINNAWDQACEDATDWQAKLQTALLEVREIPRHATSSAPNNWLLGQLVIQRHLFDTFLSRIRSSTGRSRS